MKKVLWTIVFWILILCVFAAYVRFFNKDLGNTITHFIVKTQVASTWSLLTWTATTSPIMEKITALDTEIDIVAKKIQERKEKQLLALQEAPIQISNTTSQVPPLLSSSLPNSPGTIVKLFYFNAKEDQKLPPEQQINVHSLLPVNRSIQTVTTPIKDTINALLQWALTTDEINQGFTTEFPNKYFRLLNRQLAPDGTLTLEFTEVPGFTDGGSARMLIIANSIIKTAQQFPEVKKVLLMPETLFQP